MRGLARLCKICPWTIPFRDIRLVFFLWENFFVWQMYSFKARGETLSGSQHPANELNYSYGQQKSRTLPGSKDFSHKREYFNWDLFFQMFLHKNDGPPLVHWPHKGLQLQARILKKNHIRIFIWVIYEIFIQVLVFSELWKNLIYLFFFNQGKFVYVLFRYL